MEPYKPRSWIARLVIWFLGPRAHDAVKEAENRRTVLCVKRYFTQVLGAGRLNRVCSRYNLNLDRLFAAGKPLLSRDLAKILVGIKDVKILDIEELIQKSKEAESKWPKELPFDLRAPLQMAENSEALEPAVFARVYEALGTMGQIATVPKITAYMCGGEPTEVEAQKVFDPFLADRERLALCEENPADYFEAFVHNTVVRTIGREMNIGMLLKAPNHRVTGAPQFYRVSGKIISGKGMVSYIFTPATANTDLKAIRFFRGTSVCGGSIDALSTMITDMERDLGKTAYESGKIFEPEIKRALGVIPLGAGHSLGSTTLQYFVAEGSDMNEVYCFNGPGLPVKNVEAFNERMRNSNAANGPTALTAPVPPKVTIHVRDTHLDPCITVGKLHLGYDAPEHSVLVDYRKYYPEADWKVVDENVPPEDRQFQPMNQQTGGFAHVHLPDRGEHKYTKGKIGSFHGLEGGFNREQVNQLLNRKDLEGMTGRSGFNEGLRLVIGPIFWLVFTIIKFVYRLLFGSRADDLRGLETGRFVHGKWVTEHQTPEQIKEKLRLEKIA